MSETINLYITPLSPIHMGTGEDYQPTNYVIDDGVLYEFDSMQAMRVLPDVEKNKLNQILSRSANPDTLKSLQSFFYSNKDRLKAIAKRNVKVNESVEQFYKKRVGKTVQYESRGVRVQNKLEIGRTAWNPISDKNYLVGSGIKGAIRTALLDKENNGRHQNLDPRKDNNRLQKELFQGSFDTDPLRLVSIADAMPAYENIMSEIVFELNKKKSPVKNKQGQLVESQANKSGIALLLEVISPLQRHSFISKMTAKKINGDRNKIPAIQYTVKEIFQACNQYFIPILLKEMQTLTDRGFVDSDWRDQVKKLTHLEAIKNNTACIVRIGRHSGAESMTINGVRKIKIMQGKNEKAKYMDKTTTIWLASQFENNQRDLIPFGWALLELGDTNFMKIPNNNENYQQWFQAIDDNNKQAKLKIAEQIASEEKAEEDRILKEKQLWAAEKQAKIDTERKQAEFDALPESAKKYAHLQKQLEAFSHGVTKQNYAELVRNINEYLAEAQNWTVDERQKAAENIETIYTQYGWGQPGLKAPQKRKQEAKKRQQLQDLLK